MKKLYGICIGLLLAQVDVMGMGTRAKEPTLVPGGEFINRRIKRKFAKLPPQAVNSGYESGESLESCDSKGFTGKSVRSNSPLTYSPVKKSVSFSNIPTASPIARELPSSLATTSTSCSFSMPKAHQLSTDNQKDYHELFANYNAREKLLHVYNADNERLQETVQMQQEDFYSLRVRENVQRHKTQQWRDAADALKDVIPSQLSDRARKKLRENLKKAFQL